MALILDATPGGEDSNTYIVLSGALEYFESRLYADSFVDAASGYQEQALAMATRQLDERFIWSGTITFSGQALDWPRENVINCDGYEVDSETIPVEIQEATCEQALYLLQSDSTQYPSVLTKGFKYAKVDTLEIEPSWEFIASKISPQVYISKCLGLNKTSFNVLDRGL